MKKLKFEANKKTSTIQTRSKLRKLTGEYMEDLLTRFPHIGEIIFDNLDDQSILSSKQVSKTVSPCICILRISYQTRYQFSLCLK